MIKISKSVPKITLQTLHKNPNGVRKRLGVVIKQKNVKDVVEVKKTIMSPFEIECRKLFEQFTQIDDVIKNEHDFGYFIRHKNNNEISDSQIKIFEDCVKDFLEKVKDRGSDKPYHLINILYSTIIKVIKPQHILQGQVQPQTYRDVIDHSIKMYNSHILKDGVDYRHILGRLNNLQNMSTDINKQFPKLPKYYAPINWKSEEQLNYMSILEIINKHFQEAKDNLSLRSRHMFAEKNECFTKDIVENVYSSKVLKTIGMLYGDVIKLIQNPRKNYDEIKSKIEIAEEYFDRLPVNDKHFPEAFHILNKFKKLEDNLYKSLSFN